MQYINCTPHDVNLYVDSHTVITYKKSGSLARVELSFDEVNVIDNVIVKRNKYSDVKGLPKPKENTIYIVSFLIQQALLNKGIFRKDLVSPNDTVRDEEGKVIGCSSWCVI